MLLCRGGGKSLGNKYHRISVWEMCKILLAMRNDHLETYLFACLVKLNYLCISFFNPFLYSWKSQARAHSAPERFLGTFVAGVFSIRFFRVTVFGAFRHTF